MALINNKIADLQAAIKDVDLPGSIKLPDTASIVGNALMSPACKYLRPGQGIVLASNAFTIKSVTGSTAVTVDEFKDRMGNRGSIEKSDLYTDGNLFNLKNCAGALVYSIDATGTPVLHTGLAARTTDRDVTIEAMRAGLVVVTGTEARLRFVSAPGVAEASAIDRLGFPNTLHEFRVVNRSGDPMALTTEDLAGAGRDATKTHGTIPARSIATVSVLVGIPSSANKDSGGFVIYVNSVTAASNV